MIIIDSNKKNVSINKKYSNLSLKDYEKFVNIFFRIIREWKSYYNRIKKDKILIVGVIEKDKQYDLYIGNSVPDNFNSFLELIYSLF